MQLASEMGLISRTLRNRNFSLRFGAFLRRIGCFDGIGKFKQAFSSRSSHESDLYGNIHFRFDILANSTSIKEIILVTNDP